MLLSSYWHFSAFTAFTALFTSASEHSDDTVLHLSSRKAIFILVSALLACLLCLSSMLNSFSLPSLLILAVTLTLFHHCATSFLLTTCKVMSGSISRHIKFRKERVLDCWCSSSWPTLGCCQKIVKWQGYTRSCCGSDGTSVVQ